MLRRREFRDQPWRRWRVKDGEKGPMIWEVKHARFFPTGLTHHFFRAYAPLFPAFLRVFHGN